MATFSWRSKKKYARASGAEASGKPTDHAYSKGADSSGNATIYAPAQRHTKYQPAITPEPRG
ncbi:hypothetical protein F3C99_14700 [Vitellibacter sp. q18]|nr:hypothetical protein [Aequorivita lutea]